MNLWSRFQERWLNKFVSSDTQKNISVLMTGTAVATIFPILFSPVMTRIYSTVDYGVLGLYISITTLIGVLAYVHFPQAIMLSKDDNDARNALWFSVFFCLCVSLTVFLIVLCLYLFVTNIAGSILGKWLLLMPVSIFFSGSSAAIMVWANRHQQYKILASSRMFQAILTVIIQISLGLLINNETGLLTGFIVGQITIVLILWYRFRINNNIALGRPDASTFKAVARKNKKLFLYYTPSEFINNLINQLPVFLLQKFAGLSHVGNYNFTQRLLGVPQLFLSSAIVEVFKQKATFSYNAEGNCRRVFMKTFKSLVAISLIPFILIVLFSPQLFAFVFGEEWRQAGEFARYLGGLYFLRFIVRPLSYVYTIAGKYKEDFILHIIFLIATISSFYVANQIFTDKKYLILVYSITYGLVYIFQFFRAYELSKGHKHTARRDN